MALKPGYKQTEVGMIPVDWDVATIDSQSLKVGSGITPTGGERVYRSEGRPFVRSQNIGWGSLILDDIAYIDNATHAGFSDTEIQLDDVFLNITGASIGRSAVADTRLVGGNVNQHVCIIRTDRQKMLPRFLNFFLLSAIGQRQIDSFQAGGNRQGLNFSQVRSISLPLPATLAEQTAIAEALSDTDAHIAALEQLIAKKRLIKQGAMRELLTGRRRLPGFAGKSGYKQTEVGMIPENWDATTVGQCIRNMPVYGVNAPAIPFDSRFPTYLRITDINEDGQFSEDSKTSINHPNAKSYLLEDGDIVFARTGASVGKSYLYNPADGPLVFAGFLICLTPDPDRLNPSFLAYYVQTTSYWNWVRVNSMRSGQPGINGGEFASLPIPLPTLPEQTAIAAVLSDMDAELAGLEAKAAKARLLKQGMMQELLTGRIRLPLP